MTSHLGDETVSFIGTDPDKHPQEAWKVVQKVNGQGGGSLFVKSHPKSGNLYVDTPLNPKPTLPRASRSSRSPISGSRNQVHDAANRRMVGHNRRTAAYRSAGIQQGRLRKVWFSVWNSKTQQSAIVVVDDKTLKLKAVIKDAAMITPTGKFNVYNTRMDVY